MKARRVIATVAPKGGIGKTFIAKLLHDLLPMHGRRVAAWDLDAATGTFAVYHDDIKTFDLTGTYSTYSWLDDCHRDDVDDVLIDVPGGRIDDLLRTFGDNSVEALVAAVSETTRELVIVNPIGVMIAETVTAQVVLNAFAGTAARIVIVKNGRFGGPYDFVIYDGIQIGDERRYGATGALAADVGAETVFLNAFSPNLLAQADAERLSFIDAAGPIGAQRLGQLGATRMRIQLVTAATDFRGSSLDVDGAIPQRGAGR
ncbi:MAG: ParA family protein [Candidatus Tyrphobacter sp.]